MVKNQLSVFAAINGIGAASGLYLDGDSLYVISDNSAYLYAYNVSNQFLHKIELLTGLKTLENIAKADKPDFEVLCHHNNVLYILGSGSTSNRNLMLSYHLTSKEIIHYNLSPLYAKIKEKCKIDNDNFNIEGAAFDGVNWFLFNRGNGSIQQNGVFKIKGADLTKAHQIEFTSLVLLKQDQKVASFTDAILYQNQLYFIAAVEDTKSTYEDGQILGSYIGSLNAETLNLNYIKQISAHQKFEGLTFYKQADKQLEFLLCEDRDNDNLETTIYHLRL